MSESVYKFYVSRGLCWRCQSPAFSKALCLPCLIKDRERKRAAVGCRARQETGIGRIPIEDKRAFDGLKELAK